MCGKCCTRSDFAWSCQLAVILQMPLLEAACKDYLLSLKLCPLQLSQLLQLFDCLDYTDVLSKTLKRLCNKLWLPIITGTIANVIRHLILLRGEDRVQIVREALQTDTCGKLCQLQVWLCRSHDSCSQFALFRCMVARQA